MNEGLFFFFPKSQFTSTPLSPYYSALDTGFWQTQASVHLETLKPNPFDSHLPETHLLAGEDRVAPLRRVGSCLAASTVSAVRYPDLGVLEEQLL